MEGNNTVDLIDGYDPIQVASDLAPLFEERFLSLGGELSLRVDEPGNRVTFFVNTQEEQSKITAALAWVCKATTDCRLCRAIAEEGFGPSHNGSKRCESGSIASGGDKSHCSCDTCF